MILISKESDFKNSHFIKKQPKKSVKIRLGSISNQELITIFSNILTQIQITFSNSNTFIIEIGKEATAITSS